MNGQMLGLSRLAYSLATNRQIPSAVGPPAPAPGTPYVAITLAAVIAFAARVPHDMDFLAGIFAFGAMITFAIAHLSVIALRFREAGRPSAFRRAALVPVPRAERCRCRRRSGALLSVGAWVERDRPARGRARGRRRVDGARGRAVRDLPPRPGQVADASASRFPPTALQEASEPEYGSILVPVFGETLDDDIVGTAGRLAAEHADEGEGGAVLEALYVFEIPMSLPIDARVPDERVDEAKRVLARAKEVGEEYEGVEVATAMVRGRTRGPGDRGRGAPPRRGGHRARRRGAHPRARRRASSAAAAGRATASSGRPRATWWRRPPAR